MTDLLGVRDGVMRPLTVDAFERWLRSDDVERDGEMSAQQWAQLWFVMETIALWPEPSSDDEGTAVDAPVEAGDDATTNTAAKLAGRGAADDDDAEGTAVRPSPAEARMADEIRQILRNNDVTGVPSPGVMTHPDDLAAPLVRFALARGAAGVISGAHVGATGANAIDALEWIRREKAQSVESLCGEHHADFTRAMRELDGVRDGMRRLGDATKAQNAEVQRAGGGLLESMDRFGSVANEEASIDEAVTKTRLCADALRCAARCDEALSRGDLLRAVRRCDEIERIHVPGLPKGASALGEYLRDGVRKARARAERHANRSARDWLVAARDVGRVFGAAAIARETGRGVMSGGIGSGSHLRGSGNGSCGAPARAPAAAGCVSSSSGSVCTAIARGALMFCGAVAGASLFSFVTQPDVLPRARWPRVSTCGCDSPLALLHVKAAVVRRHVPTKTRSPARSRKLRLLSARQSLAALLPSLRGPLDAFAPARRRALARRPGRGCAAPRRVHRP